MDPSRARRGKAPSPGRTASRMWKLTASGAANAPCRPRPRRDHGGWPRLRRPADPAAAASYTRRGLHTRTGFQTRTGFHTRTGSTHPPPPPHPYGLHARGCLYTRRACLTRQSATLAPASTPATALPTRGGSLDPAVSSVRGRPCAAPRCTRLTPRPAAPGDRDDGERIVPPHRPTAAPGDQARPPAAPANLPLAPHWRRPGSLGMLESTANGAAGRTAPSRSHPGGHTNA